MPKRKSAFSAAIQEAQLQAVTPSHSETVEEDHQKEHTPLHGTSVSPQHSETVATSHDVTVKPFDSDTATQQKSETVENIIPSQVDATDQVASVISLVAEVDARLEQQREAAKLSHSETVTLSQEKDRFTAKISFYLTPEQGDKLDDLAHDFKKQHKKRINRNDIVRFLIDACTLETLDGLKDQ
jgi:hypothetical protein